MLLLVLLRFLHNLKYRNKSIIIAKAREKREHKELQVVRC
jgi:hypothetical protein